MDFPHIGKRKQPTMQAPTTPPPAAPPTAAPYSPYSAQPAPQGLPRQQTYTPPAPSYTPPAPSYTTPAPSYQIPAPPPASTYTPPSSAPTPTYTPPAPAYAAPASKVAVVDFSNFSGDAGLAWMGEALAVVLEERIGGKQDISIIPGSVVGSTLQTYGIDPARGIREGDIVNIGTSLAASSIVTGSYTVLPDGRININASVYDGSNGNLKGYATEAGTSEQFYDLTDRLLAQIDPYL